MTIDLTRLDSQHPAYATVILDKLDADLAAKQASLMRSYVAHRKEIVTLSKGRVTKAKQAEINRNQHIVNAIRDASALVVADRSLVKNYMEDRVAREQQALYRRRLERRRELASIPNYDGISVAKCNVPDERAIGGDVFFDTAFRPAVEAPVVSFREVLEAWFEGDQPMLTNPDFFEVLTGEQYVA